jgi:DNA-directed RNA polymerase specialized sigma24 family protein
MEARTDIWAKLSETIRRFMRHRVRDQHLADDLAQDVMLKAQVSIGGEQQPVCPSTLA